MDLVQWLSGASVTSAHQSARIYRSIVEKVLEVGAASGRVCEVTVLLAMG